ncbi:LysR substrate-binding domain-containing protein [Streptomyces sp. NBC_01340]|uniref:LysR substrate-binding domain-containing protein n=1 Tax=unclassified Streptomyces TaxID=2593676 RepID=UPI0022582792|nr:MULTISPECIES: LysR substrate-binding domain-containing protein [unclassified Streptomyces]MCX4458340.1 LysR substrate-binding domain-containing protein [Streptomyces sp. NBC_01719]MCX4497697.1 LysR substrate-binding domain-containing protein [Streptomyces sp. NBC_01728]MCX4596303.1 LysR substrate-binding domain-containing protein [Streptomyces sp. NBC_01549]WSI42517.1 LysR substrate-binding domain-containing protein [Streptomyces sp. NBC_01340]
METSAGLLESATRPARSLLSALARDRPGIEPRLMTAYSGHPRQWLHDGDLDLSLRYNPAATPSPNARLLVRERGARRLFVAGYPDQGVVGPRGGAQYSAHGRKTTAG